MKVKDIPQVIDVFSNLFPKGANFQANYSNAWHFNECYGTHPPYAKESGVYFYTKPNPDNWNIPMVLNEQDIWYIGKSSKWLANRVWGHVGPIIDPETNQVFVPRFKYHQWENDNNVTGDIKQSIAEGNIVVYTIAITGFDRQVIEKYLLACYFKAHGRLPVLNKDI